MKRLFLLLMFAVVALSCEEIQDFIDPKGHGLVFLEGEMKAYFDDKGDTKNYKFQADLAWSAEVSADWVEVNPTSGPAGENKIKIKVDKNKSDERRTGYVDITLSNDKSYRIELEQLASGENLDDVIQPTNSCPSNEIWYTNGSTTEPTYPNNTDAFGVNIVSNTYDAENERWVIKFDGDVTTIGEWAFNNCRSLTSVTIPDSVTTIGEVAFYECSSLTSIAIPDSVTAIGEAAFKGCSSLTSVTIPDSVTTIGNGAFSNCYSLRSVTIPDSVTTIGYAAFDYCSSLTSVTIPDSVTTIGEGAFAYCDSLTSVTIGDSVTTIGGCAFESCSSLTSVTISDSVTTIGGGAFRACSSLTSVTIPDSVTTIGDGAFAGCDKLREFNGKFASEDGRCLIVDGTLNSFAPAGLTEYTIPNSVTTIGGSAFAWCRSLTSITIPDSVTSIGEGAFQNCSSLTSVTIGDSVTTIGDHAFYECSSLTSVTIPDSVTSIGDEAFFYCSSLTSVTIGDSVTSIGDEAFFYCSSLTSVTIGDSVTLIGNYAFYYCTSLTSVYCKGTTPATMGGSSAFNGNASGRKIYVPMESVEAYKSASYWNSYADAIVGYDF